MAIAVFNPKAFLARYPEFSQLDGDLLAAYFMEAGMYCRNDGGGPVQDLGMLTTLLNMLTAHIAALNGGVGGQAASQIVGRITTASEGSVSLSTTMKTTGSSDWYMQTKYGAAYWQLAKSYILGGHFAIAPGLLQL